jgi:phage gp29-like protein
MDNTIKKEFKPKASSLLNKITRDENYVLKNTISRLHNAMVNAQSIERPNRYYLLEIYNDVLKDPHLQSVIKHRKERIKGLKYNVLRTSGKEDSTSGSLFNQLWFKKFLNYTLDAMFFGNSLIEIDNNLEVNLIPRANVIPEFRMIKISPSSLDGDIDYTAPIYSNSLVDVNSESDNRNVGELMSISKYCLIKNEVLLNWSQYIELFGQPIRVATTDSTDEVEIREIFTFLEQLGRSGYMVKNSQTDIEFTDNTSKSSSSELFLSIEKFIDEQISKRLLGGTMITDSGSSRSQSEVHERSSYLFTKSDIGFVEEVVNNQLIPILVNKGVLTKNVEFKFQEPEIQSIEEKIKIDEFLLRNFNIKDISYFEQRYGVKLEVKSDAPSKIDNNKDNGETQN